MNTLEFVNFLIVKIFPTLIRQNFPPSKFCAIWYNQVQSFQINDYTNHYEDIEITGYRAIYSKNIAGRGIAILIRWLGTARPIDCFNKSVSDCYIRIYQSF